MIKFEYTNGKGSERTTKPRDLTEDELQRLKSALNNHRDLGSPRLAAVKFYIDMTGATLGVANLFINQLMKDEANK